MTEKQKVLQLIQEEKKRYEKRKESFFTKYFTTKEKLKHQLFIGKVSEVIGFEKTVELLKQVNEEIN